MKYIGQVVGITFKSLGQISDENHEILNSNIDTEALAEKYGYEDDDLVLVTPIMRHEHSYMEPHPWHYRCFVSIYNGAKPIQGVQDIYEHQLEEHVCWIRESEERFFIE